MSLADVTPGVDLSSEPDNTAFGMLTGADVASMLQGVGQVAQVAGTTAVQINAAVASANAPVTAKPVSVNPVTGSLSTGLSALTSGGGMGLILLIVLIAVIAKHS